MWLALCARVPHGNSLDRARELQSTKEGFGTRTCQGTLTATVRSGMFGGYQLGEAETDGLTTQDGSCQHFVLGGKGTRAERAAA